MMVVVNLIAAASRIAAGLILAAIVAVTAVAIFYRYFLGTPIIATEELSRVLLILLAYCGGIALPHLREHMAVEFTYDLLPPRAQLVLDFIHYALGAAFLGILAYSGYQVTGSMGGIRLPALQIQVSNIFTIVAVACALHALVYVRDLVALIVTAWRGRTPSASRGDA
ncbi:TRAP transporter small permease [Acuticoccus kandeliae]|uniref:TRAP transporter small permease n=1 Tax=Acuticoccus kandeliae TaxID=2073160 RepID=UPI000D3ECF09|nr:TRAP transporter small permease subunit [Acuticoccus kandeliae]